MAYEIDQIIRLMEKASELGVSVELEDDSFSLKIDGIWKPSAPVVTVPKEPVAPAAAQPSQMPVAAEAGPSAKQGPTAQAPEGTVVKSPIVGTFYAAAAPEKPPFVTPGKQVKKGDVLYIIESMKLMNEVTSELDGTVTEILVKNGEAVEYGQPIMVIA